MNAPRLLLMFGLSLCIAASAVAQDKKSSRPSLPTGAMPAKEWLTFPTTPLVPGELDQLINAELKKVAVKPAPPTNDEQFVRRVYLDVTGKLPTPTNVSDFVRDTSVDKRAKLIDKLLDSDDYAKHWATYWREVISSRTADQRSRLFGRHFEVWLVEQFKANKSWGSTAKDILTATGDMKNDEPAKNGQAYFLNTRTGADAATELAAETSRIFLGIQIQCAQCHDHPSDVWKREQFHEFAAYFSRVRGRPLIEEKKLVGQTLASLPFGEHQMPSKDNPKQTTTMRPKFLDGKAPPGVGAGPAPAAGGFGKGGFGKGGFGGGGGLSDSARRKALADAIVAKDDPWFAGAFVNRMWGALMGQSFYLPVDDLGPEKEATMPDVLGRVSASFRGSDYDVKTLLRAMLNSEAYQRQIRPGESPEEHLLFAANNPNRLPADMLYHSLVNVLGNLQGGPRGFGGMMMGGGGPFGRFFSFEAVFKQEFAFDPSARAEDVEGTVSQALMLMNNAIINQRIKANGPTVLGGILSVYSDDDEALRALYLKALARRPTDRELTRTKRHIREANSRAEAYEDILWALINSTEFQTRR